MTAARNANIFARPGPGSTVVEVREYILSMIAAGRNTTCPCCTRPVAEYYRTINVGMARALINQWRAVNQEWTKTRLLWTMTHEGAQLRWWGLIEGREDRDDGGKGGTWRITDLGRQYVLNQVKVPRKARVCLGALLGLDDSETAGIQDALGTKFRYDELMRGE